MLMAVQDNVSYTLSKPSRNMDYQMPGFFLFQQMRFDTAYRTVKKIKLIIRTIPIHVAKHEYTLKPR